MDAISRPLAFAFFACLSAAFPAAAAQPDIQPAEVKRALQAHAPGGVRLSEVTVAGQKATIRGASQNNEQVSRFLRSLDDSKDFRSPSLVSIAKDPASGGSRFELTADIHCPKPGEKAAEGLCAPAPKASSAGQSIYKCRVNGTFTVQATPCDR